MFIIYVTKLYLTCWFLLSSVATYTLKCHKPFSLILLWKSCNAKLALKRLESQLDSPCGFCRNVFSGEMVKPWCFVTLNIIISDTFPENFIEISQFVQKIWRFSPSILTIFIDFTNFDKIVTPLQKKYL